MNFNLMSGRHPQPSRPAPRRADLLIGAFLFLATAAFVLWQNTHLTVLWDLSYILENATRIRCGQVPYRDFPFPYAPLTFLVQAAIIKLFGRLVLHHYLYAALAGGLASLLTWRILLRLLAASRLPARLVALLLAAPLIFLGTNSIFPHPFYDSDCTLFILFCIWLLLRLEAVNFPPLSTFACGILLAVPPFIKQNTGLAFLAAAAFCIACLGVRQRRAGLLLLAGAATGFVSALALIQSTAGLANYFHWTVQFAASRRLPGVATMFGVYRDSALVWSLLVFATGLALFLLPAAAASVRWIAAILLSLPFLWALVALFRQQDASDRVEVLLHLWPVLLLASLAIALWQLRCAQSFAQLLPLVLLAVIHGAFLSQQLWGSTYALWPLLMILIATILVALVPRHRSATSDMPRVIDPHPSTLPLTSFAALASLVLLVTGGYYALSHERLDYVDLSGETLMHSSLPPLGGLAMRGDWLPDFEELVAYTGREIPPADAILMLPGEDLFYFTTGRTPQFPVLMLDNTVNPYSADQIAQLARQHNVGWLIVKRTLQLQEQPISFRPQLIELLSHDFSPAASLNNYDIYRRNSPPNTESRSTLPGLLIPLSSFKPGAAKPPAPSAATLSAAPPALAPASEPHS
jgi:4-amino-4-deoxy-L-arabinose transferase-like glycosyltransferase